MREYRIEDSHFLQYATRYEVVEGMDEVRAHNVNSWIGMGNNMFKIQIKTTFNYWFADYESFSKFVDILAEKGYTYVKAIHNAYTDGRGNVIIRNGWPVEDEYITPTRFYKGIGKNGLPEGIRGFSNINDTTTKSGKSRAWIITGVLHYSGDGKKWDVNAFLAGNGRGGKFLIPNIKSASLITEDTAKQYIKNHANFAEGAHLRAISIIDYLARN